MSTTPSSELFGEAVRPALRRRNGSRREGSLMSRLAEYISALFRPRRSMPADLTAKQIEDAGIAPGQAGRGPAADVDAATIANLNAMR